MKRAILTVTLFLAMPTAAAFAVSISEFDNVSEDRHVEVVVKIAERVFSAEFTNRPDSVKQCLSQQFTASVENPVSPAVERIIDNIDKARQADMMDTRVQDITYGVMLRLCDEEKLAIENRHRDLQNEIDVLGQAIEKLKEKAEEDMRAAKEELDRSLRCAWELPDGTKVFRVDQESGRPGWVNKDGDPIPRDQWSSVGPSTDRLPDDDC